MIFEIYVLFAQILHNKHLHNKHLHNKHLGNDERYPLVDETYISVEDKLYNNNFTEKTHVFTEDKFLLNKIIENHKKKQLLNFLESDKNNYIKINEINNFYGKNMFTGNISSGGLLDDWNCN